MAWCSSVSKSPSYMVQVGPGILKLKGDYPNSSVHVVTWIEIYFRVQGKGLFPSNFWENPEGEPHPCLQSSHDLCTSMASSVCPHAPPSTRRCPANEATTLGWLHTHCCLWLLRNATHCFKNTISQCSQGCDILEVPKCFALLRLPRTEKMTYWVGQRVHLFFYVRWL